MTAEKAQGKAKKLARQSTLRRGYALTFAALASTSLAATTYTVTTSANDAASSTPDRAAAVFASAKKTLTATRGSVAVCTNERRVRFVSRGAVLVIR